MMDRVYPSAKPSSTVNGTDPVPATATTVAPSHVKLPPQLYRPYRPQPAHRGTRRRCRCTFCCCCFWTVLFLLTLSLLATIAGAALYVLYRPRRPAFSVSALRVNTLNLTASASDPSISHLVTSFNLTLTSKNPNTHFTFFYDQVTVTFLSGDVFVGNSSIAPFTSNPRNQTVFRGVAVLSDIVNLDTSDLNTLRTDLKRSRGIPLKIQMDTKVRVKTGKLKSKKVGFRLICDGFKGVVPPKGKSPSVATVTDSKCKVDLRFRIWRFTF